VTTPTVVVDRKGAERLRRRGQVWVFRSDLLDPGAARPGDVVRIVDPRRRLLGHGFYGASELALRLLDGADRPPDAAWFRARLEQAIARRRGPCSGREALRLVHGESDRLPGLLVDRFGAGLVVQSLCQAIDQREEMLIDLLVEQLQPATVVVRDDGATRDYEALPRRKALVRGADPMATYREGELRFTVDLLADQKTGAVLDQHDNHLLAGRLARGAALDLFCYHGGFGLQMARRADRVTCVDQSESAIGRVQAAARDNQLANVTAAVDNAFDHLRGLEQRGARFDTIVIDPPAFAKRKSAVEGAWRGYKDLNLRAMRILAPGGLLVTCSCSARFTRDLFEQMLMEAATDAHRRLQLLERRGAGPDHPALLGVPETLD
jgi:23S rRNA (cytosine1962-C5)-methyltransferase